MKAKSKSANLGSVKSARKVTSKVTANSTGKPTKASKPAKRVKREASAALRLISLLVAGLDSKKAEQVRVLQVGKLSSITDYLVLATGTSDPHLRALRIEAERILDGEKTRILGVETTQGSGWIVLDAFDVMVHLFTAENRSKYRMEQLWKDAEELPVESLLRT